MVLAVSEQIRVLVLDDHQLSRASLRSLVENQLGMQVVGDAPLGPEALAAAANYQPDVFLINLVSPLPAILEIVRRLRSKVLDSRIVFISNHESANMAMGSDKCGYVTRDSTPHALAEAIQAASIREKAVSADSSLASTPLANPRPKADGLWPHLTIRQKQVLQLIAVGRTSKEISRDLKISVKTVESHRTALMRTLDIHNVVGLVHYALRAGVL